MSDQGPRVDDGDDARALLREELVAQQSKWTSLEDFGGLAVTDALRALVARDDVRAWIADATEHPARDGTWSGDPAHYLAVRALRFVQTRHQFVDLRAATPRIVSAHRVLLRSIAAGAPLDPAFVTLGNELRATLRELLPSAALEVVCAEHAPALQLKVLGLDPETMLEPILDLGCGEEARLVHLLREAGKIATGVDRIATPGPFVQEADWFEVELAPSTYGTIISHLGFTHHFLHHELRQSEEAFRYARRYMEIVRALIPGGTFAYAPGVPFVEDHLAKARFEITKRPIEAPRPEDERIAKAIPLYACHVRRRG